ncbi:MAG: hypothetical protein ISR96_03395 [Nitrospira sp.]|nr:hypothetical protein [Nitrospira sp.]
MNKWIYIKGAIIIIVMLITLWTGPIKEHADPPINVSALVIAVIFGILGLQFILMIQALNKKSAPTWHRSAWEGNPFSMKQPVHFFHFASWIFIISSTISALQTWFKYPKFILDSLMPLCLGIGILLGVHLSTIVFKHKFN